MRELFARSEASTRQQFAELRGEVGELRGELTERMESVKRHFDVTAEQMRGDTELLAEVIEILQTRMGREFAAVRAEMAQGFKDTQDFVRFAFAERRK